MSPPVEKAETQPRTHHHRFAQRRKRQRLASLDDLTTSPHKEPRAPLGEIDDAAANEVRRAGRGSYKSANQVLEDAIKPLAGVPEWLLKDCLDPTEQIELYPEEDSADQEEDVEISAENNCKEATRSKSVNVEDVTLVDDPISSGNGPEVDNSPLHNEGAADSPVNEGENDYMDLPSRLQALPAYTLRSLIYDIALTDGTGHLEAELAETAAARDVPSATFGYHYFSVDWIVTITDPETQETQSPSPGNVEDARHMIEELLLDIAGQISTESTYPTKRAALVAILKIFDVVFGSLREGNRIAIEMPADVEEDWASLFEEVFSTLTTFEKEGLAMSRDSVFLKKLDGTISSITLAGSECAGRKQQGVLAELTRASIRLGQHGEIARRVEELERVARTDGIR